MAFPCNLCKKVFVQQITLNNHVFTHRGEKAFACNLCKKAFVNKQNLRDHMFTHRGEKAFSCSEKSFAQKRDTF